MGRTARDTGLRFLVWFEPERAMPGTWLEREHADWLLTPSDTPAELGYMERDGFRLLDLGNARARAWAMAAISKDIRDSDRPSSPMERSGADLVETGIEIRANAGGQQAIVPQYTPRAPSSRSR